MCGGGGGEGGTKDFNFYIVILIVTEVNLLLALCMHDSII